MTDKALVEATQEDNLRHYIAHAHIGADELEPWVRQEVRMNGKHWVVIVPAYSSLTPETESVVTALTRAGIHVMKFVGHSDICSVRSQAATWMLDAGYHRAFWLDSDQHLHPLDVLRMLASGLDFLTAVAPARKAGEGKLLVTFGYTHERLVLGNGGTVWPAKRCGFGSVVTSRRLLANLAAQMPRVSPQFENMHPLFLPMVRAVPKSENGNVQAGQDEYLAEDFAFCQRASDAGFQLYADTRVRVTHYGTHGFRWEDLYQHPRSAQTVAISSGSGSVAKNARLGD